MSQVTLVKSQEVWVIMSGDRTMMVMGKSKMYYMQPLGTEGQRIPVFFSEGKANQEIKRAYEHYNAVAVKVTMTMSLSTPIS